MPRKKSLRPFWKNKIFLVRILSVVFIIISPIWLLVAIWSELGSEIKNIIFTFYKESIDRAFGKYV